ncbi:hypothetical protein [Sphaerospermopsis sp. LEGE 08334]|uniref:hypothetical protein n=1 Tax=Sphaerospermopsis sp. LEGE 08334 TaxID=1828651 RepID=UPI00187FA805|nr:hypothetical protein [Sphaerospermopsis sp. LEGE 08334]MBE9058692.1 hypothetical protein [Sphaerospermopsis sp. LEGE 08334]
MAEQFPIIEVPLDASQDIEDLGTKEKFWFYHPDLGRCLFKKARSNTGEDWAIHNASEILMFFVNSTNVIQILHKFGLIDWQILAVAIL